MALTAIIAGPTEAQINSVSNYFTMYNMDVYTWTVTNGTILNGQGTNAIDVLWNATGTVEVYFESGGETGDITIDVTLPV